VAGSWIHVALQHNRIIRIPRTRSNVLCSAQLRISEWQTLLPPKPCHRFGRGDRGSAVGPTFIVAGYRPGIPMSFLHLKTLSPGNVKDAQARLLPAPAGTMPAIHAMGAA
jgi:hypothetical protein